MTSSSSSLPRGGTWGMPVSDWLAGLRLEQYSQSFLARGLVAVDDCLHLDNQQLELMGVMLPGHRKRILGNLPPGDGEVTKEDAPPIPKERSRFLNQSTETVKIQSKGVPPIPPRASHGRLPRLHALTAVAMTTACDRPTPKPKPRIQNSQRQEVPPSVSPSSSLALVDQCSLAATHNNPLVEQCFLAPTHNNPLAKDCSSATPPSLPLAELHLYEQCSLDPLPPLPPKAYTLTPSSHTTIMAPPIPRRPPEPPQRPSRSVRDVPLRETEELTRIPDHPSRTTHTHQATTLHYTRSQESPGDSDDYEEPDLPSPYKPTLDMASKDGFLAVPQQRIRHSDLYSDDELLDDDQAPPSPNTRRKSWQDYGISHIQDSVYLPPKGRVSTPVDDVTTVVNQSAVIKMGWLEKTPPLGPQIFQRRWVKVDADYLRYYDNDKEVYSKRIISTWCFTGVCGTGLGDLKFELATHNRTFLFRTESEAEKREWMQVLLALVPPPGRDLALTFNPSMTPDLQGFLELRGLRSKLYTVVCGDKVFLYKSQEDYKCGIGITSIDMNVGNIKDTDRRSFDLTTPYRIFSFVADSEPLKEQWVTVLQESVAMALSHSEVADRIWAEPSNGLCADCSAPNPDWASINLGVCVCKRCAGEHRSLGPSISKVRSLKMDHKIWTEELIQVFLSLGNERANHFWAANVPPSEAVSALSSSEDRHRYVTAKYRQGKYRRYHPLYGNQLELHKALCVNVQSDDLLETLSLIFCGADVNGCRGNPEGASPLLLAQQHNQRLQVELLTHNRNTEIPVGVELEPHMDLVPVVTPPSITMNGFLFKTGSMNRPITERKSKEEFSRRWCVLNDGVFSYYESDRTTTPSGTLKIKEIVCLAINPPNKHGYEFSFELYSDAERLYLFAADNQDIFRQWVSSLAQCFVPAWCGWSSLQCECDRVGRVRCKDSLHLATPQTGWFCLQETQLHVALDNQPHFTLNLHKLKELSIQQDNEVLVLVERGRSLYLEAERRLDFLSWATAIQAAAGSGGDSLNQQQLTDADVPVIVDRCLTFIYQCGLTSEGIYRKSGVNSRIAALLEAFRNDARSVFLKEGEQQLDDVANTLKRFFRDLNHTLFATHTHTSQAWLNTTALADNQSRISQYQQLLSNLPRVNKATLQALVNHLYCVQCFAEKNQMNLHNLAIVFGPTLFQTDGKDYNAGRVIEDLIEHYVHIFNVDELQLKKQLDEQLMIIKLRDMKVPQMPGGHFICTVYLEEKKESAEQLVKIPATMSACELVCEILDRRQIDIRDKDYWSCFEVNEKEETERPLHYQERVLPIVHSLGTESHLLVKRYHGMESMLVYLGSKVDVCKHGMMRFREERSLLGLSTGSFHERYFILTHTSLRMYKDVRSNRAEREWPVKCVRVYQGIKKKLRSPTCWGLTVIFESDKPEKPERQQWYLCCDTQTELREWFATFLSIQHEGSIWPPDGCNIRSSSSSSASSISSSSSEAHRRGNVSLIPLRGNERDIRNSVAAAFTAADTLAIFRNT